MKINIKTAMTALEAKILRFLSQDSRVLEIGALLGFSTVNMAHTAKEVVSVDPHNGYPYYNPRPTLPIFMDNIRRHGVKEKIKPVVGLAQDVLPYINQNFELVFVDCTGFYNDTMFCLENSSAPIKAVHDFFRGGCSGATKAVIDYAKKHDKRIEKFDTLAVIS